MAKNRPPQLKYPVPNGPTPVETFARVGGLGGLALFVFLTLYSRFADLKPLFGAMSAEQTYDLLQRFLLFSFATSFVGIVCWVVVSLHRRQRATVAILLLVLFAITIYAATVWATRDRTKENVEKSLLRPESSDRWMITITQDEPPAGIPFYVPVADTNALSNELLTKVYRLRGSDKDRFWVSFTIPAQPIALIGGPPPMTDFTEIRITIAQRLPDHSLRIVNPSEKTLFGHWVVGESVRISFDLPHQYSDPDKGWEVRYCIGESLRCNVSPNLLVDSGSR